MKILVTGTDGYIGSVLAPRLIDAGHEVVGLDNGFYRDGLLYNPHDGARWMPQTLNIDLRNATARDLEGFDAVVHLAELSNDPLGQHNRANTFAINHLGSVNLAKAARAAGVPRFVYASSCSVYGVGDGQFLTETDAVNPQTAYAECKILVERDVGAMADGAFSPVFLRNATAYGASPRMRFDIVLNNLSGLAWTTKRIAMTSDGSPWRPLVHVQDICRAIECAVEAPKAAIHGQIFNVGADSENYRVREIAQVVADEFAGCELSTGPSGGDNRSYRVSFAKISSQLPGFRAEWTAKRGAAQLHEIFERIAMSSEMFGFRAFTRLKQLEHLIRTRQIDDAFFWKG